MLLSPPAGLVPHGLLPNIPPVGGGGGGGVTARLVAFFAGLLTALRAAFCAILAAPFLAPFRFAVFDDFFATLPLDFFLVAAFFADFFAAFFLAIVNLCAM
jgi:hypothetical protein